MKRINWLIWGVLVVMTPMAMAADYAPDYIGLGLQQAQLKAKSMPTTAWQSPALTFTEYQFHVGWRFRDWLSFEAQYGRGLGDEALPAGHDWLKMRSQPQLNGWLRAGYPLTRRVEVFAGVGVSQQRYRFSRLLGTKKEQRHDSEFNLLAGVGVSLAITADWRASLMYQQAGQVESAQDQWRRNVTALSVSYLFP